MGNTMGDGWYWLDARDGEMRKRMGMNSIVVKGCWGERGSG